MQCLIHGALLSTSASPHFTLPHAFQIDGEGEGFVQMDRGKILTALRHNKERFEVTVSLLSPLSSLIDSRLGMWSLTQVRIRSHSQPRRTTAMWGGLCSSISLEPMLSLFWVPSHILSIIIPPSSILVEIQRLRHVKGDTNRLILTEEKRSFVPLEKVGGRVVLLSKEDFSSRAYSEDEGIFYWTASHISGERSEGRKLSWGERGQEGDCYNDPDF